MAAGIEHNALLHKIGDVAEMVGTSIRAIRFYEEEGLLAPLRSDGGTRLYSSRHVGRLRAILRLAKAGCPIDIIKTLARTREESHTGDESQRAVSQRFDTLLADIDAQMKRLDSLREQIAAARRTVTKCSGCRNMPSTKGCPECPVRQRLSDIELLSLVWDQEE
jgi:DNA-binding transcriptional MerR regulator